MSRQRRPQLLIGEHKFFQSTVANCKATWRCTRQQRGCRARVMTIDKPAPFFGISRQGRPQIWIGEYRFNKRETVGSKVIWRCTRQPRCCRAIIITIDERIVRQDNNHNH
ncbi:unnamed protein product, partial [Iphiclides podalirius]